ncbi:hypothetical protein [Aneurinibacillus migulanus]|uniref:hypothetical protein n=1 Tax=Aneurinibacillus migulanus TaxID=47500 RepID=UPI000ADCDCB5|nr:hypothetical protein [Aneurinibacillus migulanus]MED0896226.1 hypothetical protein [Aneurinibacillus migulanus]MED1618104.1 hypothetical protein [Aneurinibacillus migulanus]MED4732297.1 hypothetical protein [Aneurinibacillus migulanus]
MPPSKLTFISKQVALNEKGEFSGADDYGLQARQAFTNPKHILGTAGTGLQHVA